MHDASNARPTVKLRKEVWDRHMNARGLTTPEARAEHIGLSRTTVWRIEDGRMKPGEGFVAAVLARFRDLKFEDLFDVVREPERESA